MAITYVKDIPDFNIKVKQITDITELETTVNQLSASMLEVQGDITTLANAVTVLDTETNTFSASGETFSLSPTSEGSVLAHTIYGMSEQDGTPTPSNPVTINSASANFTCANSDSTESVTITTDLTLRAIEVTASDDYNLVRGEKYYIADSVDWSEDNGYVLTRRIGQATINDIHAVGLSANFGRVNPSIVNSTIYKLTEPTAQKLYCLMDKFLNVPFSLFNSTNGTAFWNNTVGNLYLHNDSMTSLSDWQTWIVENPVTFYGILQTPTTSSLTATQAEALLSLKTYDVATSITCTADVDPTMTIEYAKERTPAMTLSGHNESNINSTLFRCNETTAGTYTLKATVASNGLVSYAWTADS